MTTVCRACGVEHPPTVRCEQAARRNAVTVTRNSHGEVRNSYAVQSTDCAGCVEKDREIDRLQRELERVSKIAAKIESSKNSRAAYMRRYRKAGHG